MRIQNVLLLTFTTLSLMAMESNPMPDPAPDFEFSLPEKEPNPTNEINSQESSQHIEESDVVGVCCLCLLFHFFQD